MIEPRFNKDRLIKTWPSWPHLVWPIFIEERAKLTTITTVAMAALHELSSSTLPLPQCLTPRRSNVPPVAVVRWPLVHLFLTTISLSLQNDICCAHDIIESKNTPKVARTVIMLINYHQFMSTQNIDEHQTYAEYQQRQSNAAAAAGVGAGGMLSPPMQQQQTAV